MKLKKIIFLDIDGVLNTTGEWGRTDMAAIFSPKAVAALDRIIEETKAYIVISSSWKWSGIDWLNKLWEQMSYPGRILAITPYFKADDSLPFKQRAERGNEIKLFVDHYNIDIESYVIIDDDDDVLPEQEPYFVQTDSQIGLTDEDATKTINILNRL